MKLTVILMGILLIMTLKHFKLREFNCSATGENYMNPLFLERLDILRERVGFPFVITSGYRSPKHPEEIHKDVPGQHTIGVAVDIKVENGVQRYKLVKHALEMGFTGIGIAKTFVHIDDRNSVPVIWTY